MKNIIKIVAISLLAYSCSSTDLLRPFGPDDSSAPGTVTDVVWEALPGGAKFTYTLPMDSDLSYVKAVYSVNGDERTAMASQYNTSLSIEGLPDCSNYEVKLYCMDTSNNASEPYIVEITPEESPVNVTRNSLTHEMDFGGFRIQYENPSAASLVIQVYKYDEVFDAMRFYDSRGTTQTSGEWQVIDLPNELNDFSIVIKDQYENLSEAYTFQDTPWHEVYCDKSLFNYVGSPYVYDKDDWYSWAGSPYNVWDDIVGDWNFAQTSGDGAYPHYFCIDLGANYPIGRLLFQQRTGDSEIFATSCPKKFDLYGVEKLPAVNSNDPLEGWTKLNIETFEVVRPSGRQPGEAVTEEDKVAASEGIFFTIDTEFPRPEIRYLRIVFTEGFQNNMTIIGEFSFWAQWR